MRITREKHMAYLTRLMPLLLLAVLGQGYLYTRWAPFEMALDVSVFMGVGLALIAAGFAFYDHFHRVELHRHHLCVRFDLFQQHEEILYRDIQNILVEPTRHAFYNVVLELRDGSSCKLYYLDDIEELKSLVRGSR